MFSTIIDGCVVQNAQLSESSAANAGIGIPLLSAVEKTITKASIKDNLRFIISLHLIFSAIYGNLAPRKQRMNGCFHISPEITHKNNFCHSLYVEKNAMRMTIYSI